MPIKGVYSVLFLMVVALSWNPAAADVSRAEIADFAKWGARKNELCKSCNVVLRVLKSNLPKPGIDRAAEQLAWKWRIDPAVARNLAEGVLLDEIPFGTDEDAAGKRKRMHASFVAALDGAPSSPEVWDVILYYADSQGLCDAPRLQERYFGQQAIADHFLDPDMWKCSGWILDYPKYRPMTPLAWRKLRSYVEYRSPAAALAASQMLLNSVAAGTHNELDSALLYVHGAHMKILAEYGLSAQLIDLMEGLSGKQRSALLMDLLRKDAVVEGKVINPEARSMRSVTELRSGWVLALSGAGRQQEAAQWVRTFKTPHGGRRARPDALDGGNRVFAREGEDESEFLHQVISGPGVDDPYELFVGDGERGLLWDAAQASSLAQRAASRFMREAGYHEISSYLLSRACHRYDSDPISDKQGDWSSAFSPEYSAAVAHFRGLLKAAEASLGECGGNARDRMARREYREIPLDQAPVSNVVAEAVAKEILPSSSFIVRAEQVGDRISGITLSQDIDPVGEVSGGGYWLERSEDGGRTWMRPLYLGLQQYYPYEIPGESRLPLLNGRVLQLEVEVRELDEASITFPPVALRTRREAKGLYIELSLDELEQDSDEDGLTDLLEDKLRTDPRNPDTDGDTIPDAVDSMPQVSARAEPHALAPIIIDVLRRVTGYEASAIQVPLSGEGRGGGLQLDTLIAPSSPRRSMDYTFFAADPTFFNGITLPGNAIVLTEADITYLETRFGLCYPVEFPVLWLNRARDRAVVRWSAGWVGGTVNYRLKNGQWEAEETSRWIT